MTRPNLKHGGEDRPVTSLINEVMDFEIVHRLGNTMRVAGQGLGSLQGRATHVRARLTSALDDSSAREGLAKEWSYAAADHEALKQHLDRLEVLSGVLRALIDRVRANGGAAKVMAAAGNEWVFLVSAPSAIADLKRRHAVLTDAATEIEKVLQQSPLKPESPAAPLPSEAEEESDRVMDYEAFDNAFRPRALTAPVSMPSPGGLGMSVNKNVVGPGPSKIVDQAFITQLVEDEVDQMKAKITRHQKEYRINLAGFGEALYQLEEATVNLIETFFKENGPSAFDSPENLEAFCAQYGPLHAEFLKHLPKSRKEVSDFSQLSIDTVRTRVRELIKSELRRGGKES